MKLFTLLAVATLMVFSMYAARAEEKDGKSGRSDEGKSSQSDGSKPRQSDDNKSRQSDQYHLALARTYNMHAHDHARMLEKYAALSDQVPGDVVREHTAAIRFNAEAAKRANARLSKSARDNAAVAKHVEQLQKRFDEVNASLKQLESQSARNAVNSKMVLARTQEMSRQLRANHNDILTTDSDFYNSGSDSYYTTGEGHFVD